MTAFKAEIAAISLPIEGAEGDQSRSFTSALMNVRSWWVLTHGLIRSR